jgi:hypothetical protein
MDPGKTSSSSEASLTVLPVVSAAEPLCAQRQNVELSSASDSNFRDFVSTETSDHAELLLPAAITESHVESSIVGDLVQNSLTLVAPVSDMNEIGSCDYDRNTEQSLTLPDTSVSRAETNIADADEVNTDLKAAITFHVPPRLSESGMVDVSPQADASGVTHAQTLQAANEPSEPYSTVKQKSFPTCLEDIEHRVELDDYKSVVSTAV